MEKVRIQDDLYTYVNGEWIENAVIPDDKPVCGGFSDLDKGVEELLISDFNKMIEEGNYPNELVKRACVLFNAMKDVKRRNKEGIKPVLKDLKKLDKITSITSFNRNLKTLVLEGYPLPFSISVDDDMKDSNKHCLMLSGPSTFLPDTTYYKPEKAQQKEALIGILSNMMAQLLSKTKLTEEEQAQYIQDALKFDEIIATLVKSSEEWSDYIDVYNPTKTTRVATLLKPVKYKKLLEDLFGFVPETTIVADVRFLKGFKTLFNEENFELYKHWAYIKVIHSASSFLSEELREIGSSFRRALTGTAKMLSAEKYAYRVAGGFYDQPIGLYYGEKYFGEEAKKDVVEMVQEIIDTYKKRVANSTILSDATKEKAILKLSTMKIKMGYPDSYEDIFNKLVFDETLSAYGIVSTLSAIMKEYSFSKLTEPVDKAKWVMPGHMVNACYNPTSNDITFPAGILQAPFYSIKQTRSQNLGGIGAVIGHEISHAFDNNGAKMDENGNINNWWTKEDFKRFNQSTKAMIKEFEGIVLPFGTVNASFTVSENIADNGGMAVTLDIMSRLNGANYEEYFINWAKVWCMKAKPEYEALLINVDVHAPHIVRANIPPRNFQEWYDTFNVTKKDKMYIAPNKRVVVW